MNLETSISGLTRVGQATANKLKSLGIKNAGDLLFYLPFRYEDYTKKAKINDLQPGQAGNVVAEVELINNKRTRNRRMTITEALVVDDSGTLRVVWFNQPFIAKSLKAGDEISLAGKVEEDMAGLVMKSPVYEKSRGANIHTQGLVPVYHLTAGLTQKQIRFLIGQVVRLAGELEDWLPDFVFKGKDMLSLGKALSKIHFPENYDDIQQAKQRLAFGELYLLQLQSQVARQGIAGEKAEALEFYEKETRDFVKSLPFTLTDAQKVAAWEVIRDLGGKQPMTRLLEGDVGSGKTVVAVLAMYNAVLNHKQSALMVPTEILAVQHYQSLGKLLAGSDLRLALLTSGHRSLPDNDKPSRKQVREAVAKGEVDIVIGTHALIQEEVEYHDLAFVVIDEQHRFGVEQRQKLKNKKTGLTPHLLSMTATPIPRSLALALYDDLSISIIKEMPKNRKKIITRIVEEDERPKAYEFIGKQLSTGRQAFVVCPLIDPSDKLGARSVKAEYKRLKEEVFKDFSVGMMHGRLKAADKKQIMQDFADNKIQALVSTQVVEVGVDVPNASIMMIESAERFGLAQLHQYRGRVGRGEHQSYCLLMSEDPGDNAKQRLEAMLKYNNGFDLSKADLEFRGPGEVYGRLQKGFPELRVASLYDFALMKEAKAEAKKTLDQSEDLSKFPLIKKKIKDKIEEAHLE